MTRAVIQRIGAALAVLVAISAITFTVLRVIPGDAATLVLGLEATPEKIAQMRVSMGLDDPLPQQYLDWVCGVVAGDWGVSRVYGAPVGEVMASALPVTLLLAVYAMVLAFALSLPLGVFSALRPGSRMDAVARTIMQIGAAVPGFWLAIVLMLVFASSLGWFPVSGYTPFEVDPAASLRSLTLPAVVLAVGECGVLIRTVRSSMMSALARDCMLSTQVKGLTRARSIAVYALRSSLVAPLTVGGMQFAKLVGGTVVIESVFALPGLGRLLLTAVSERDVMLVQGVVIVATVAVVVVTLLVDIMVMVVEPRVREQDVRGGGSRG